MTFAKLCLIFLTILIVHISCRPHHKKLSFPNHMKLVSQFSCSVPQPRSVPVLDLIGNEHIYAGSGNGLIPASTVLHRCGGSGCCDEGWHCGSIKEETIIMTIMIRKERGYNFKEIAAKNHTACGCQRIHNRIK